MTSSGTAAVRGAAWVLVVPIALVVGGCGGSSGAESTGSADCALQIRDGGAIFSSYGSTSQSARKYSVALEAACEDTGPEARGSVFSDESRQVTTYRFPGYRPAEVLGVRYRQSEGLAVFVAESVSDEERDRILAVMLED